MAEVLFKEKDLPDVSLPRPTSSHTLFGGMVEIHCFGKGRNWSLAGGTPNEADWNNPGIRYRMYRLAKDYDIGRIYAPNPSRFNGKIVHPHEFNLDWAGGRVYRGPFAEGVLLSEPNTAFAVSSADCPTVVMGNILTGRVIVAHAGFKSLVSCNELLPFPLCFTMIDTMNVWFGRKMRSACLYGFITCGIGGDSYRFRSSDKGFTDHHRKMCERVASRFPGAVSVSEFGWNINLATLIRLQFDNACIGKERFGFDGVCTYSDIDCFGNHLWHSNRRGDKTRNLVLVIRR